MCHSAPRTRHRPQEVEIGTVLGLSPPDAKPGYAPQWAQHSTSVKRPQRHHSEMLRVDGKGLLAKSASDGVQGDLGVGSCPHTYQERPKDISAPPAAPRSFASFTSFTSTAFSSPLPPFCPSSFPLITPSLCAPLLHVLARQASPTRPRFRLYALAKMNAGSPDTPISKRWRRGWERRPTSDLARSGGVEPRRGSRHGTPFVDGRRVEFHHPRHTMYSVFSMGLLLLLCSQLASNHHNLHKCQRVCKDTCLTFTPSHIRSSYLSLSLRTVASHTRSLSLTVAQYPTLHQR